MDPYDTKKAVNLNYMYLRKKRTHSKIGRTYTLFKQQTTDSVIFSLLMDYYYCGEIMKPHLISLFYEVSLLQKQTWAK